MAGAGWAAGTKTSGWGRGTLFGLLGVSASVTLRFGGIAKGVGAPKGRRRKGHTNTVVADVPCLSAQNHSPPGLRTAATAWCSLGSEERSAAGPGSSKADQEEWNLGLGFAEKFWGSGPMFWLGPLDTVYSAAVAGVVGLWATAKVTRSGWSPDRYRAPQNRVSQIKLRIDDNCACAAKFCLNHVS